MDGDLPGDEIATRNADREKEPMMGQADVFALVSNPVVANHPMPRAARRILELFDGSRSLAEVCALAQIPQAKGLAIVKKLSALGLIHAPRPGAPLEDRTAQRAFELGETLRDLPSLRPGFSPAEEAFFSSEVAATDQEPGPTLGERFSLFVSDWVLRIRGAAI